MTTVALALIPKVTAALSFLGSSYIVIDFWVKRKAAQNSTHHRLVAGLSTVDIISSAAFFFSTWPIPSSSTTAIWAVGNDRTCTAQGFVQEFGIAVPIYTTGLSIYTWMQTTSGMKWSNAKVRRVEPFLHAVPLTYALAVTSTGAALGVYHENGAWCGPAPPPGGQPANGEDYWAYLVFVFYIPIMCCILASAILLALVLRAIRRQEQKRARWGVPAGGPSSMRPVDRTLSRQVAIQSCLYIGTFLLTYTFGTVARFTQYVQVHRGGDPSIAYWLEVMLVTTIPLQGFLNVLVHKRKRLLPFCKSAKSGICAKWDVFRGYTSALLWSSDADGSGRNEPTLAVDSREQDDQAKPPVDHPTGSK